MIFESLCSFAFWLIESIFSVFSFVSVPLEAISPLFSFISGGVWIIGADVFGLYISSLVFWYGFKAGAGLIVYIWKLLPLT